VEYEKWGPTTYLFWAALMVVLVLPEQHAVNTVILVTFALSTVWQLVQWVIIRRQRKPKPHLEAWNYKG
jgi:threonine/homoserine/homoserine lactone efflux protein